MALPKKGRRELTVDGKLYHYCVKMNHFSWGSGNHPNAVVLEVETGRKFDMIHHRGKEDIAPSDIERMIRHWNKVGFEDSGWIQEGQVDEFGDYEREWVCTDLSPKKVKK